LHAPTTKKTIIFKQEQISRELEEELKIAFNFLKNTTTSTTKPTLQVIVILDSKEEVEILPQFYASRPMEEEELQQDVVEEQT
jgi:hypothetical protein